MKNCKQCGTPIGTDKRKDSVFCSSSCKARYHELKLENKNYKGYLGSLKSEPKPQSNQLENQPEIKPVKESEELPPLRNLLNGTDESVGEPKKAITKEIIPLPSQFITQQLSLSNPKYNAIKIELDKVRIMIQNNRTKITELKSQIQLEIEKDGSGIYVATSIAGAATGYWAMEDTTPKKKSIQSGVNTEQVLGSAICGILGFFVGKGFDSLVKPEREKQKSENIKKYRQEILKHEGYLSKLIPWEKSFTLALSKHPEFLLEDKTIPNPAYDEALKQNELIEPQTATENGLTITLGGLPVASNPLETNKILSAKNMASQNSPLLDFKDKWLDFIGQPHTNFFMVVHGMSGEGKTHFTIQFAKYLAQRFGNVLYVSGEEGFAPTMQKKIKEMGAMVSGLYFGDFRTGIELLNEVANKYHFIIIDSINNMNITPELMKTIREHFKQSAFIAVCQSTKDDKIRGSYQIVHDCDITVKVNNGIGITTKNRSKQKGTEFDIFAAFNDVNTKKPKIKPDDNLEEGFGNTI